MPIIGVARPCKTDDDCGGAFAGPGVPLQCNRAPDPGLTLNPIPAGTRDANGDGKVDADDLQLLREGGARCDIPAVGFGQFCAPGVARCASDTNDTISQMGKDLTGKFKAANGYFDAMGNPTTSVGYVCMPNGTGYCQLRCDSDATNTTSNTKGKDVTLHYPGPAKQDLTLKRNMAYDTRCGELDGFFCMNQSGGPPSRGRVCQRRCFTSDPDAFNAKYCQQPVQLSIGDGIQNQDIMKGTVCKGSSIDGNANSNGPVYEVSAAAKINYNGSCQWDPAFEPRDPSANFVPAQ
jgi:hypothetical protein